jgi:hypothetical protein
MSLYTKTLINHTYRWHLRVSENGWLLLCHNLSPEGSADVSQVVSAKSESFTYDTHLFISSTATYFSTYFIFIDWQIRTNMTMELGRPLHGPANNGGTNWHTFADCGEILFLDRHPGSTFISSARMVYL